MFQLYQLKFLLEENFSVNKKDRANLAPQNGGAKENAFIIWKQIESFRFLKQNKTNTPIY